MNAKEIQKFEAKIHGLKIRARKNPGQLVRFCAGSYYLFNGNELVEISRNAELSGAAKWIAREENGHWYSDPYMTLAECKADLLEEKDITPEAKPVKKLSARMLSMLRDVSFHGIAGIVSKRDRATLEALEERRLIIYQWNQYAYLDKWVISPAGTEYLNNL